jgi:hypothetical protein
MVKETIEIQDSLTVSDHRDDKGSGKIVERDDHLMDTTRYLILSGRLQMQLPPEPEPPPRYEHLCRGPDAWMQ